MPADESTTERQEGLVDVGAPFIANAQTAKLIEPGERPFHHPPVSSQPAAMFGVSFRD
jgi:hypothetical protein